MPNAVASAMMNFVPKDYYETVMDFYGVDIEKYPWMIFDFDPGHGRVMHAVFNFEIATDANGRPLAAMKVVYKSLHSKSSFHRIIYLDNMSPACQVPLPYRYRNEGE